MAGLDGQPLALCDYFGKTDLTREDIATPDDDYIYEMGGGEPKE